MKVKQFLSVTISLFLITVSTSAWSADTNACHCFKDRIYNPADRFAADDYILATSFNSLISNAYDIPKKQIVFLKMKGGADHMDLIIAPRVAKVTGTDLQQILDYRKQGQSWKNILFLPGIATAAAGDQLLAALATGTAIDEVGPQIADTLIADFYTIPLEEVKPLRASGIDEKEMALIFILAHEKKAPPAALADMHLKDGKSWSQIANDFGLEPAEAGKLILQYTK